MNSTARTCAIPSSRSGRTRSILIYSGNQYQGSGNPGNQTGGTLYYKSASATAWSSVNLGFDNQTGNNKYWRASFNTNGFGADDVIQYYLLVTYSDHDPTYVYGGDNITKTTGTQSVAAAAPYTVRNRPAFVFHDNNRIVNGTNVQFSTKVGYIGKDGTAASQWVRPRRDLLHDGRHDARRFARRGGNLQHAGRAGRVGPPRRRQQHRGQRHVVGRHRE